MGFYLSIFFDLIFAIAIGIVANSFWTGVLFYLAASVVSTCLFFALWMLVDKSVQEVLTKIRSFNIIDETEDYYILSSPRHENFSVNKKDIFNTEYDLHSTRPYITIEEWQTKWYVPLFYLRDMPPARTRKIILNLPVQDEV